MIACVVSMGPFNRLTSRVVARSHRSRIDGLMLVLRSPVDYLTAGIVVDYATAII